jgi:hypothetical protein
MKNHNNIYNSYTKIYIPAVQMQNYILHVNNQYFMIAITVFAGISVFKQFSKSHPTFSYLWNFYPISGHLFKSTGHDFFGLP